MKGISMEIEEALGLLKYLVSHDHFHIVNRRDVMAQPVSRELAKSIVQQLQASDFQGHERNRNNPTQFVWIFITDDGERYYIKFVFVENDSRVVFISFHVSY